MPELPQGTGDCEPVVGPLTLADPSFFQTSGSIRRLRGAVSRHPDGVGVRVAGSAVLPTIRIGLAGRRFHGPRSLSAVRGGPGEHCSSAQGSTRPRAATRSVSAFDAASPRFPVGCSSAGSLLSLLLAAPICLATSGRRKGNIRRWIAPTRTTRSDPGIGVRQPCKRSSAAADRVLQDPGYVLGAAFTSTWSPLITSSLVEGIRAKGGLRRAYGPNWRAM